MLKPTSRCTKKEFIAVTSVVVGAAILIGIIGLVVYNATPRIVYQPAKACDLFTASKAQELLGNKIVDVNTGNPVISGNTATSKCSYTDDNSVESNMIVAALAVRSGINDKGIQQNKTEFASSEPTTDAVPIEGLGDSAYFNPHVGQLNILKGHNWFILSYGAGSTPESNTLDKATELARKILN